MSITFKITNPIRLIELFAGIGSQAMALKEIGADFETYRVVEFDKYAIASYNAIHGTNFPTMDITKIKGSDLGIVDTDKFTYLLTYSFPCQDLSVAGKGRGMTKGNGTRSGLLWEVERLLEETDNLPQVLVMENVPQVHSKKNMDDFNKWLGFLESKGYSTVYKDLNAMDYDVAQSRNRCFAVSILGDFSFCFPEKIELTKVMKDYLEDDVDEKYYLTSDKAKDLIDNLILNGKILTDRQLTSQSTNLASSTEQTSSKMAAASSNMRDWGKEAYIVRNCGSSDESREPEGKPADIAATLLSRDYKGLSNYGSNACIEYQRIGLHREGDGKTSK